jgi:hypothetical protein
MFAQRDINKLIVGIAAATAMALGSETTHADMCGRECSCTTLYCGGPTCSCSTFSSGGGCADGFGGGGCQKQCSGGSTGTYCCADYCSGAS